MFHHAGNRTARNCSSICTFLFLKKQSHPPIKPSFRGKIFRGASYPRRRHFLTPSWGSRASSLAPRFPSGVAAASFSALRPAAAGCWKPIFTMAQAADRSSQARRIRLCPVPATQRPAAGWQPRKFGCSLPAFDAGWLAGGWPACAKGQSCSTHRPALLLGHLACKA